jgi:transposase
MRAYSQDLRDRVLEALARGERPSYIARRYEVGRPWGYQVRRRWEETEERGSLRVGGYRVSRIAHKEAEIKQWIAEPPDMTLKELSGRLAAEGMELQVSALWSKLNQWGCVLKKTLHAGEQSRADVQQARAKWKREQPQLEAERLVFLDETAAATPMTRLRGRSLRGERCVAAVPQGHRKTTTFIAGLRHDAVSAPLVLDGPMNGAAFVAYPDLPVSHAAGGRHRGRRQAFLPQGRRRQTSHEGDRRHDPLLAAVFPRSQPHREDVCQTQSPVTQSRHSYRRGTLERNRQIDGRFSSTGVFQLLRFFRICP